MNSNSNASADPRIEHQQATVRDIPDQERDQLIVSATMIDDAWVVVSRYCDDTWQLTGGPTNSTEGQKQLNFTQAPRPFRGAMKEMMYRYLRSGLDGGVKPNSSTLRRTFTYSLPFLRYLEKLGIRDFGKVTPIVCLNYVAASKKVQQSKKKGEPALKSRTLENRFRAVELLYETSQYSSMPFRAHPWPESSAKHLAGQTGASRRDKTPLMPDDVFTALFQSSWKIVQSGDRLLTLRDDVDKELLELTIKCPRAISKRRAKMFANRGWDQGFRNFTIALTELSTACYIVIASLSGCRNHELAYLKFGAYYSREDDSGEVYWWMQSQSDKTGARMTEWMVPEAAVVALRIMDRWSAPLRVKLSEQIRELRTENPLDPRLAELLRHSDAVFLTSRKGGTKVASGRQISTKSAASWNFILKSFAKNNHIDWDLATHHFRRKFANYAARSRFGDLRYLREHFKHWSQDVTNDSYAFNENHEIELYAEIQSELDDLKFGTVERWLEPSTLLAGGYGRNIVNFRRRDEGIALFKDHGSMVRSVAESHAIRSNGHAWCTADDQRCIGNSFEKSRCGGCDNAVIDGTHASFYQHSYDELLALSRCDDIGSGGQARVRRDLARCREVLTLIGYEPKENSA